MTPHDPLTQALARITDQHLSTPARVAHVALLLVSLGMAIVLGSLLATEPGLPLRTQGAFGVMLCMALAWAGYATWTLRHRQGLLANHRVMAGTMAVAFSLAFTAGAAGLGFAGGQPALRWAALLGAAMSLVSVVVLVRARRHRMQLRDRRDQLERELRAASGT
ncbi:hypothetical protein [Arenimonas sp. MALMAid1274]|uniref:hypothetical protein n=1 Tax=Arenimonas sp. MALMAid1274 TaxID=3411630 RepID=UPI003BA0A186